MVTEPTHHNKWMVIRRCKIRKVKILLSFIFPTLLAGCASFQPKPILPFDIASAFEARTLDNPGLREFIEQNRKQELGTWPLRQWDLQLLTLAAFYYHPIWMSPALLPCSASSTIGNIPW